ncbi:efflux RND transporter periplasmic adaptor subunit [Aestuariivivens sediminis]|uniref:efflux RND transporter periplasmic adaptor subunit n=1 Tax=Aestuariivivens sediminis TaxID=2913557 RepID=UPI001F57A69F|nr:efflux RND transporter periplasmic adaptor subunit [Aestuariivivens sediminis]
MINKIYLPIICTAILLLNSCGEEIKTNNSDDSHAVPVIVSQATSRGNQSFLTVSGKIQAKNTADLSTKMMGFIQSVPVHIGEKVQKGQLLVRINNTDLQAKKAQVNANIAEARASFNNAQKDYERFKNLFSDQSASQKELDDMTARFEMAKARLDAAEQMKNEIDAQFAYTNITAPFSGVVTHKTVEKGDMANPGQLLISIENPEDFEVIAMVPETEISQINKGTAVEVLVKSINKTLTGKVSELSSSARNTGGQYMAKIDLDKSEAHTLSGMFATVVFPVEKKAQSHVVLIPKSSMVIHGQLSGVYTVSHNNTAILRWLRIGRTFGDHVEVLSGLNSDETYIVSAEGKLFNGAKVTLK